MTGRWASHDRRDEVIDFIAHWSHRTELPALKFVGWLGITKGKFYDWKKRYGKVNEHNGLAPRDHWLEADERRAIIDFQQANPLEGYRRLAFMGLDQDAFAVSASSVYRVLRSAGVLKPSNRKASKKGTGFAQPSGPHRHWHIDITYLNIGGTFYYLCCILDGYSRFIVHWEIGEAMKESDIELILERGRELFPGVTPRIISDNGPQFVARDFKTYVRLAGMTHVRTSPYYPQSNGKIEALHKTIKITTIRPAAPESVEEARRLMEHFVEHYNNVRLHSAIGYVTPADKLAGREQTISDARARKLALARERRAANKAAV